MNSIRPGGLMDKVADSGSADVGSIPIRDAIQSNNKIEGNMVVIYSHTFDQGLYMTTMLLLGRKRADVFILSEYLYPYKEILDVFN